MARAAREEVPTCRRHLLVRWEPSYGGLTDTQGSDSSAVHMRGSPASFLVSLHCWWAGFSCMGDVRAEGPRPAGESAADAFPCQGPLETVVHTASFHLPLTRDLLFTCKRSFWQRHLSQQHTCLLIEMLLSFPSGSWSLPWGCTLPFPCGLAEESIDIHSPACGGVEPGSFPFLLQKSVFSAA